MIKNLTTKMLRYVSYFFDPSL